MSKLRINIDGREFSAYPDQTILDVARANGIEIPTLCHDERVKNYGACGICVVEAEGSPKLFRACSTYVGDGMIIKTDTPKVRRTRQAALELLLSDHRGDCRPPCVIECPGHTDCQGYVGLIANGEHRKALELIKDKIPMPASIGRVCPHPCETACRRKLVEEPISIVHLKAFAADRDLESENPYIPDCMEPTGKTVAVIGGGPGGLSAAYFLAQMGHQVTVYDAMPKMGGMLRYGIPEYRLPKQVVDKEVALIEALGVKMVNGVKIGKDIAFEHIRERHDTVVIAIGAWSSMRLRCPGEQLEGVIGGIDFLRDVALNNPMLTGKKVAIVGGGNTAMDACRTAVRLGASEVYNIYRRTKTEMPAEDIEIQEAEEEGVCFKNLTNPIEIVGDGKVQGIRLQMMELGEADASGRRTPVPIEGQEETIAVDTIIVAIGQGLDPEGFEKIGLTKRQTIQADESTFSTNLEGVFAIGDATNKGASIAIEAIGDAKRAAKVIHAFLEGNLTPHQDPYLVVQDLTKEDFKTEPKVRRESMPHHQPAERKNNFIEVNFGYTQEQAEKEASRCLECGCADYFECKLIHYANQYDVHPEKFDGETHQRSMDFSNPFIFRNPDKCILCGLCVRVCDEVMGRTALGLAGRGFDTAMQPELALPLAQSDCISCGQCVHVCPTGALGERISMEKPIPAKEHCTPSVCAFCSVGCNVQVASGGNQVRRNLPDTQQDKQAILCAKGRFGNGELQRQVRIGAPLVAKKDRQTEISMYEGFILASKTLHGIQTKWGKDAVAVTVSDKYTNEEIFTICEYARKALRLEEVYSFGLKESGLETVFGRNASTTTFDEMEQAEVIVLVAEDIINSHTIAGIRIKRAVERGAQLILISNQSGQAAEWASMHIQPGRDLSVLREFVQAVCEVSVGNERVEGVEALKEYLKDVTVTETARQAADLYVKAKSSVIVYDEGALSVDSAVLLADAAALSGHVGKPRNGLIALKANNNSQGLSDMGVRGNRERLLQRIQGGQVKALIIFGEDVPDVDLSGLEFLIVQDYLMTETAEKADLVLPAAAAVESSGTYTSTDRKIQVINAALPPMAGLTNIEFIRDMANITVQWISYENLQQVQAAISHTVDGYRDYMETMEKAKRSVYWPVGEGPVLYREQFATESGNALLSVPQGRQLFDIHSNTHGMYTRFMKYMEEQELIRN